MGQGFIGRAALSYFDRIEGILDSGEKCINASVQMAGSGEEVFTHSIKKEESQGFIPEGSTKSKVQEWNMELLNNLSQNAVATDDDKYEYLYLGQTKQEENLQEKMEYVLSKIETLCTEKFVMPTVTPKVEKQVASIRKSMQTSQKLTEDMTRTITQFAKQIDEDDR